jgi:hypothetical protein
MLYALDNGAWMAAQADQAFDIQSFIDAVDAVGSRADFIVSPDIVGGGSAPFGAASLAISLHWLGWLMQRTAGQVLLPVQDGMRFDDLAPHVVAGRVGLFLGGSTEWKTRAIIPWGRWAAERGVWCHAGRVNTPKRLALVVAGGCSSFDGSSVARFPRSLTWLEEARSQLALEFNNG